MTRFGIILLGTMLPLSGFAQQGQQIPWTTVNLPAGNTLNITIPSGGFQHWVVGVNVAPGESDRMEVVDGTFAVFWPRNPVPKSPPYFPMTAHPESLISVSGDAISLGGSGQTLVTYVGLSHSRSISITAGNNPPISMTVNPGLLVADGVIKGSDAVSDRRVLAQGMVAFGASLDQTPKPIWSHDGVNEITEPKYLRSHLTHYVAFPAAEAGGQVRMARLEVNIGADGRVQRVSCGPNLPATGLTCDEVTAAITQWAFDPFFVAGKPAPVVAWVMLISTPSGLISTVSPGASLSGDASARSEPGAR